MKYRFYTGSRFDEQFKKLDRSVQIIVNKWIQTHLINTEDPYASGKPLSGNRKGYWRYRIGSYRLLVRIIDDELIILAIDIDHRSVIYR